MKVIIAESLGLCFGVREALALAERVRDPVSVTIHGELVHNEHVLERLQSRGFRLVSEAERNALPATPRVMITAHGVSDRERARLASAGLRLIDTTCPLVRRVHRAARELASEGRHIIVVGRPGHVEVQGILEDLPNADVVETAKSVRNYRKQLLGVICQSTTSPTQAAEVFAAVRAANPGADVVCVDTICQPTRDRQDAIWKLLPQVDAVVVVGGRNSNNTRALLAQCHAAGKLAFHVQSAGDIETSWFRGCRTVGLTAGTSTLDETIEAVRAALAAL